MLPLQLHFFFFFLSQMPTSPDLFVSSQKTRDTLFVSPTRFNNNNKNTKAARGDYTQHQVPQCSILLSLAALPVENIELCPQAV